MGALLATVALYVLGTLLVWPPSPWQRLGIIPVAIALLALRPSTHAALVRAALKPWVTRLLLGLTGALVLARLIQFGIRLSKPISFMEDIAGTYWESLLALLRGLNPYAEPVDPTGLETGPLYQGFKYPPLQILLYAPGLKLAGLKGYLATNGLVYFGFGHLIFAWLRRISIAHACLGALFYYSADHLNTMICVNGVNDVFPTLLLFLAVLSIEARPSAPRSRLAGVLTGLSALCKQFPAAALYGAFLLLGRWRSLFWAGFIFSIGMVGFLYWDPWALLRNLFEFQILRPWRTTSFLGSVPEEWRAWIRLASAAGALLAVLVLRRRPLWDSLTLALTFTILSAKLSPPNFFVWVTPFFILVALDPGNRLNHAAPHDMKIS